MTQRGTPHEDDGIVIPVRFLNFIGEDGQSQLQFFIGADIVLERDMECCPMMRMEI